MARPGLTLSLEEAAKQVGLTATHLRALGQTGLLPVFRRDGQWLVTADDLERASNFGLLEEGMGQLTVLEGPREEYVADPDLMDLTTELVSRQRMQVNIDGEQATDEEPTHEVPSGDSQELSAEVLADELNKHGLRLETRDSKDSGLGSQGLVFGDPSSLLINEPIFDAHLMDDQGDFPDMDEPVAQGDGVFDRVYRLDADDTSERDETILTRLPADAAGAPVSDEMLDNDETFLDELIGGRSLVDEDLPAVTAPAASLTPATSQPASSVGSSLSSLLGGHALMGSSLGNPAVGGRNGSHAPNNHGLVAQGSPNISGLADANPNGHSKISDSFAGGDALAEEERRPVGPVSTIRRRGDSIVVNGRSYEKSPLADDDVVEFGDHGPAARELAGDMHATDFDFPEIELDVPGASFVLQGRNKKRPRLVTGSARESQLREDRKGKVVKAPATTDPESGLDIVELERTVAEPAFPRLATETTPAERAANRRPLPSYRSLVDQLRDRPTTESPAMAEPSGSFQNVLLDEAAEVPAVRAQNATSWQVGDVGDFSGVFSDSVVVSQAGTDIENTSCLNVLQALQAGYLANHGGVVDGHSGIIVANGSLVSLPPQEKSLPPLPPPPTARRADPMSRVPVPRQPTPRQPAARPVNIDEVPVDSCVMRSDPSTAPVESPRPRRLSGATNGHADVGTSDNGHAKNGHGNGPASHVQSVRPRDPNGPDDGDLMDSLPVPKDKGGSFVRRNGSIGPSPTQLAARAAASRGRTPGARTAREAAAARSQGETPRRSSPVPHSHSPIVMRSTSPSFQFTLTDVLTIWFGALALGGIGLLVLRLLM